MSAQEDRINMEKAIQEMKANTEIRPMMFDEHSKVLHDHFTSLCKAGFSRQEAMQFIIGFYCNNQTGGTNDPSP